MHIEQYKSNSRAYLRLVSGKRMKDSLGRPIIGKRIVLSLGALAKHDDGKPDYLRRLRESFAEGVSEHSVVKISTKNSEEPNCFK